MSKDKMDAEDNLLNLKTKQYFVKRKTRVVALRLGPERKKYLATYPDLNYLRKEILAHRLLYFNYVIGVNRTARQGGGESLEWCKSNPGVTIPRKYKRPATKRPISEKPREEPETKDEEWQRRKFAKRMRQDATSSNVYEVLLQKRMAASSRKDLGIFEYQTRKSIYLETFRAAMNVHDWALACKSAEGVAEDQNNMFTFHLAWTGGFLATVNVFPDNIQKLLEFAEVTRAFFPLTHRAGIEVATWLTQKGAFLDGYNFHRDEVERIKPGHKYNHPEYYRLNVKRKLLDLVKELFETVYNYSCYKKELQSPTGADDEQLQRLGERALTDFERLLAHAMESDFDVTIFIEQLIELLVRFRSRKEAKDTFNRVCLRYFGNGVLEELYLKFLRENYPAREKEIRIKVKKLKRFQFEVTTKEKVYHEQILRRYLDEKSSDNTQKPLKRIPMPSFRF